VAEPIYRLEKPAGEFMKIGRDLSLEPFFELVEKRGIVPHRGSDGYGSARVVLYDDLADD
jgi:hypothetical protein